MAKQTTERTVIEISKDARYLLKAVAALRQQTMRELVEQTARDLAKSAGVVVAEQNVAAE